MLKWLTLINSIDKKEGRLSMDKHWDKSALLKRVMGKEKLLRVLVESFNEDMPTRVIELHDEVMLCDAINDNRDSEHHQNIQHIAHTIKGVAGNLSGILLQENAMQLEQAAKEKTGNYQPLMQNVESSYHVLKGIFDDFLNVDS